MKNQKTFKRNPFLLLVGTLLALAFLLNQFSFGGEFLSTSYIVKKGLSLLFIIVSTFMLVREIMLKNKTQTKDVEKVIVLLFLILVYMMWAAYFSYELGKA